MASSEDDDAVVALIGAVVARRKRKRKRCWIHPYLKENVEAHSAYVVAKQLELHEEKFQQFYQMRKESFLHLVTIVSPILQRKDTSYRRSVSADERLLIFLRFLATGMSFSALQFEFKRGVSTISEIVGDTAKKVWCALESMYMAFPTRAKWEAIAQRYFELWKMPNCLGALDGKQIRIKCPDSSGSAYYKKNFLSIALVACADADGFFTFISVGDYGRHSDGRVLQASGFFHALAQGKMNIPPPAILSNEEDKPPFPMYFVCDETFQLQKHIMRPYPRRYLTNPRRIFNKRLSTARKSVECAFGILVSKFRVFEGPFSCSPDKVDDITKAACVLHNYIRHHDGVLSTPRADQELTNAYNLLPQLPLQNHGRTVSTAQQLRDRLCEHFLDPRNAIESQFSVCV